VVFEYAGDVRADADRCAVAEQIADEAALSASGSSTSTTRYGP
jgi:hypothetical protein